MSLDDDDFWQGDCVIGVTNGKALAEECIADSKVWKNNPPNTFLILCKSTPKK